MSIPDALDRRDSSAERAHQRLQEMIVTGVLRPGDVLNEQALADQLGLGRTPVREAIQRLAWQRLLFVFPRRGITVAKLALEDVQEIFEARETIEARLAELAAMRRSERDAADLAELGHRVHDMADSTNLHGYLKEDQALHRAIARVARNQLLESAADQLLILSDWVWHRYFARHDSAAHDYFQHDTIVRAILDGDAPEAFQAMADHVRRSRDLVRLGL